MKTRSIVPALFSLLLFSACGPSGPSYEERRAVEEDERRARIQQLQAELGRFAQRNGAKSADLVGLIKPEVRFTASLQQEVEGQVVAFRATLLDVQRNPDGGYEGVFGDKFFGATVIRLSISPEMASEIMKNPDDFTAEVLVAARIDRVSRNLLTAQACSEPDCSTVSIEIDSLFRNYQANGQLIELEH